MNVSDTLAGTVVTAVGAAVGGILWLRKKYSSDSRTIGMDDADRNSMKFLVAERDKYMQMHQDVLALLRTAEVTNERLSGKVETLTTDNARLSLQVSKFEMELKGMRRLLLSIAPDRASEIFNSGFTPLD